MARPIDGHTLEYVLAEAEDSFSSRLSELIGKLKEDDYPVSIAVYFRGVDESGAKQALKLSIATKITTVTNVMDQVRKGLNDALGARPVGQINFRAWPKGESADAPINFRRELVAPSGDVDGEKEYLRRRVRELEQMMGTLFAQQSATLVAVVDKNVGMADGLQKLATARGATNAVSDVNPVSLIAGALIVPALLPVLNKQLGLKGDAPVAETWRRAQLLITAGIAKVQSSLDEDAVEVRQVEPERRRLGDVEGGQRQLTGPSPAAAPDAPSGLQEADAAPASARTSADTTPPAPVRPEPEQFVAWMVEDPDFSQAVLFGLIGNPVSKAAMKKNLPMLTAMLEIP